MGALNIDDLLSSAFVRLVNSPELKAQHNGKVPACKGSKRPNNASDKYHTVHLLTCEKEDNLYLYRGTMIVNSYAKNYSDGTANNEFLGLVTKIIDEIFNGKPLTVNGAYMYNIWSVNVSAPLFNPSHSDEHFTSVRFGYNLITT